MLVDLNALQMMNKGFHIVVSALGIGKASAGEPSMRTYIRKTQEHGLYHMSSLTSQFHINLHRTNIVPYFMASSAGNDAFHILDADDYTITIKCAANQSFASKSSVSLTKNNVTYLRTKTNCRRL